MSDRSSNRPWDAIFKAPYGISGGAFLCALELLQHGSNLGVNRGSQQGLACICGNGVPRTPLSIV